MKKTLLLRKIIFCLGFLTLLSSILTFPLPGAQLNPKPGFAEKVEYTSQDLCDPFQSPFELYKPVEEPVEESVEESVEEPPPPVIESLPHLEVQGIIWSSKTPQAIINNTVLKAGEVIEDAEILAIRKGGVYVLYKGRQYILRPGMAKKKEGGS